MPYETTRRAVERLMDRGLVRRIHRNGVIATAAGEACNEPLCDHADHALECPRGPLRGFRHDDRVGPPQAAGGTPPIRELLGF